MSITVRKYKKSDLKEWDEYVENSNNGTLFHLRSFLSYHIDRKFNDHSLIFEKKGNIVAVLPAAIEEKENKKILFSHPGASFGGFVYYKLSFEEADLLINAFEKYCINNEVNEISFVITPEIYHKKQNNTIKLLIQFTYTKP